MIERGRWAKLELIDRQCFTCGKIDDELHAIAECKLYTLWRKKYLPKSLYEKPSMYKLLHFIDNAQNTELRNLGIFWHRVFDYIHKNVI